MYIYVSKNEAKRTHTFVRFLHFILSSTTLTPRGLWELGTYLSKQVGKKKATPNYILSIGHAFYI